MPPSSPPLFPSQSPIIPYSGASITTVDRSTVGPRSSIMGYKSRFSLGGMVAYPQAFQHLPYRATINLQLESDITSNLATLDLQTSSAKLSIKLSRFASIQCSVQ